MKNTKVIQSPIGKLTLEVKDGFLVSVSSARGVSKIKNKTSNGIDEKIFEMAERQLREYFARKRVEFTIPFKRKGTDFQKSVWRQMAKIPFGKTASYIEIARRAGYPGAARAVGNTCKSNPLQILVPCHRVISAGGKLAVMAKADALKLRLLAFEAKDKKEFFQNL